MRTWIYSSEVGWDFVRRYPWSIVYYDGEMTRETTLADIPCSVDDTKRGQLEYLGVTSELSEVDFLTKLIQQSPNFKDFNLIVSLDSMTQFAAAQVLLSRHKAILTRMSLNRGQTAERWSWFATTFPTRHSFPMLRTFILHPYSTFRLPSVWVPWIVAMVSAASHESGTPGSWTPLKRIDLNRVCLDAEGWKSVIEAIDFSELQILSLTDTKSRSKSSSYWST